MGEVAKDDVFEDRHFRAGDVLTSAKRSEVS
jgi:hypothetical protein